MTDDIHARLEKLKQIEEKRRARSRRFLERARKDGRKQLSAIISGEAYDQLCRIRDATQLVGKPHLPPEDVDVLSWHSGYIEGQAEQPPENLIKS